MWKRKSRCAPVLLKNKFNFFLLIFLLGMYVMKCSRGGGAPGGAQNAQGGANAPPPPKETLTALHADTKYNYTYKSGCGQEFFPLSNKTS